MYESKELLTATQAVCSEQHKCDGLNIKVTRNPLKTTERLQLNPEDFESRPTRVKSAVLMGFLRGSCGKLEKAFQFLESKDYCCFKLLLLQNHWFSFFPLPAHDTGALIFMVAQRTLCTQETSLPPSLFPSLPFSLSSSTPLVKMPQNPSEVKTIIAATQEEAAQKKSLHHQLSEDSGAGVPIFLQLHK